MSYIDELLQTQQRPDAPASELRDINSQLFREYMSGLNSNDMLFDREDVTADLAWLNQQDDQFKKAVVLNSALYERGQVERRGGTTGPGHKSILYINELGVLGPGMSERWAEKPAMTGGFEFLKYMVANVDVLQAIILTRQRQVAAFCRPYDENDNNPLGFRLVRRDGEKASPDDLKETKRLEEIILNCGLESDPTTRRWDLRRRTFQGFIETLIADTLTADACPIETELTYTGKVAGWYNLPFETIRLAYENGYDGDDRIVAVQLSPLENVPVIGLERDEIIYEVRNPRSSLLQNDYGMSENENLIKALTSYINTFAFNAASVDRNSIPRGLLTLYGKFGRRTMREMQGKWNAMVRGASKRFGLPVLVALNKQEGGASWTPMDTATAEMLQIKWVVFLVSLATAVHGMAPEEINMESFSSKTSSLSGKDTSEKLQSSSDRGFIPLMNWLSDGVINPHILRRLTKKYRLTWQGLYPDDEERKFDRQKLSLTVDEMRAQDGEDPMVDPDLGNAPVNPSLMSLYSMKKQVEMQGAMGGAPGGAGGDGEDAQSGLPGSDAPLPYADDGPWGSPAQKMGQQQPAPGGAMGGGASANAKSGGGGGGGGGGAMARQQQQAQAPQQRPGRPPLALAKAADAVRCTRCRRPVTPGRACATCADVTEFDTAKRDTEAALRKAATPGPQRLVVEIRHLTGDARDYWTPDA